MFLIYIELIINEIAMTIGNDKARLTGLDQNAVHENGKPVD